MLDPARRLRSLTTDQRALELIANDLAESAVADEAANDTEVIRVDRGEMSSRARPAAGLAARSARAAP